MAVVMEPERKLVILYGSQTGYAEDTARRIARQAWRRHFVTQVQAMDQVDKHLVFTTRWPVIFVCSTTGQGSEPDNMKRFWRFLLRKSIPHDALSSLDFAVFGLGDSSYQKFNFPAKRLFRRLQQLGARPLVGRGDGDDQHYLGIDGQLDPWLESLWGELLSRMPLPRPIIADSVAPDATFDVRFCDDGGDCSALAEQHAGLGPMESTWHAVLKSSERITAADHFQDVRHVRFVVDDPAAEWAPGDCAVVRPQNLTDDVDSFLAAMGWANDADRPLRIAALSATALGWALPERVTLRWLSIWYFDIMGVPRRSFFEMLSYFADEAGEEQAKLREFASTEGQDDLLAYCMRPRRTVLEVLGDFPRSARCVPLTYVFDIFPALAERAFSISSDAHPAVDLTVGVVAYRTMMYRMRRGVCSRWLAQLEPGHEVLMRFARGTMRLPSPHTPIVMVGPGTGIAAFMAFVQNRPHSTNHLFFGCRSASKDFYYSDQLHRWVEQGSLRLHCAFSRDGPHKVYVQDRIREAASELWPLIAEQGAVVFVSGNANRMPDDVRQAFADVVAIANPHMAADDAQAYIQTMVKDGRYQEECWY
ncbi:NAPDH-dependent diflavin reductase [Coemansia sp. BCRC 34301]|nr:NAPDH-dependent diflavin reductase [Coemansia sp. BCRC 34301]